MLREAIASKSGILWGKNCKGGGGVNWISEIWQRMREYYWLLTVVYNVFGIWLSSVWCPLANGLHQCIWTKERLHKWRGGDRLRLLHLIWNSCHPFKNPFKNPKKKSSVASKIKKAKPALWLSYHNFIWLPTDKCARNTWDANACRMHPRYKLKSGQK